MTSYWHHGAAILFFFFNSYKLLEGSDLKSLPELCFIYPDLLVHSWADSSCLMKSG